MKNFLKNVVNLKKKEVEAAKAKRPITFFVDSKRLLKGVRSFEEEISVKGGVNLIAEIKKKSPSNKKGFFKELDVEGLAKMYEESGARALSILTDKKYFGGDLSYISRAKSVTELPVLRKDFIVDSYQVYEARYNGADAILLIARILTKEEIKSFSHLAEKVGMSSLVEVHNERDLEKALAAEARIVGVNNRDLDTFKVNIEKTFELMSKIPDGIVKVSESGIRTREDVQRLRESGINSALVGGSILESEDARGKIAELLRGNKRD